MSSLPTSDFLGKRGSNRDFTDLVHLLVLLQTMKFLSSLPLLALAVVAVPTALTTPSTHVLPKRGIIGNLLCNLLGQCCLSNSQTQKIIDTFNYLLANPKAGDFNSTVNALLADDYFEWSDSIDFIIHIPVSFTIRSSLTNQRKREKTTPFLLLSDYSSNLI